MLTIFSSFRNRKTVIPGTIMKKCLTIICLLISLLQFLRAADQPYPKVGLVLSGGGAKGISHIGVIKAFEEYQIPIHCISGVSAGALVGGLYASGWHVDQLIEFAKKGVAYDLIAGVRNRLSFPIERRILLLPEQVNIFLDKERSGILPLGLISDTGIKQYLNLNTLAAQLYSDGNFDSLAVPVRIVASDMVYQKAVTFSDGNLADIIRASMSYPIIFEPVFLDTTFYMDGGFYDNLPIQAARDMGADFIIAVNVGDIPPDKSEIENVADVFTHLSNVFAVRSDSAAVSGYDYFIQINNPDVLLFDFLKGERVYERGYEAGLKAAREIRQILDAVWDTTAFHYKQHKIQTYLDNRPGYRLEIVGNQRFTDQQIFNLMDYNVFTAYNPDLLKRDIDRLSNIGYFNSVSASCREISESDSVVITLEISENSNQSLQGGFYFDSNAGMNLYLAELNRQLFNTSFFLKNYLFAGNYHLGAKSNLTGIQSLKFPFINLRFTRSFELEAHRYEYDTNLFDSRLLRKNILNGGFTASTSIGWDRLIQLNAGIKYGEYVPLRSNIRDYIRRINTDQPYVYASFRYYEDKRTQINPINNGHYIDFDLMGGRSLIEETHPLYNLGENAHFFLRGNIQYGLGKWWGRRLGAFGELRYSRVLGYPPLLEYIQSDKVESLRYFIGKDLITTDYFGVLAGTINRTWLDNLWLRNQVFFRRNVYRLWDDIENFKTFFDYGLEISLIYNTILGPVTYGFVLHKNDNFGLNSWARIGLEF